MVGNEFSDADLFLNAYLSKNAVPPTSNTVFQNTSNTVFQNNDQEELEACKVAVGSSSSYNDISQYAHISSNGSISIAVIGDSLAAKEGFLLPGSDYPSHLKDILNSPMEIRRFAVSIFVAFRNRLATINRYYHAFVLNYRTIRCNEKYHPLHLAL